MILIKNFLITLILITEVLNLKNGKLVYATTNTIPNQLKLTAISAGAAGNLITLVVASTVLKPSSPTLINGGLFDFDNSEVFISDAVPQD